MLKLVLIALVSISYVRANPLESNHSVDQCHTWSFYNDTLGDCHCYNSPAQLFFSSFTHHDFVVQCSKDKVLMNAAFCMTIEESGTFVGDCSVYSSNTNASLIDGMYVLLPNNISELNDYMCGPLNRKGRICSECIDGFAPSVTSIGYKCSNCTGAWYGVPLYLFLEFVPITLFYLLVLVCQISVTSSPLTYCVMYSQLMVYACSFSSGMMILKSTKETRIFINSILTVHGILNLDFFLYILPPFCVSPNLKFIHVLLLKYISALYPVLLIALTWLVIEMHSRNFKPIVWLRDTITYFWTERQSKSTVIDIFATFFLLSYTKLYFTSMMFFAKTSILNANNGRSCSHVHIDPSIVFFSKEHIPFVVIAALVLLVFGVLPALLLAAYPIRILRSLLLINHLSGRSKVALDIFVEKFYSCYRDGLDGGKDMRSFASLHLFIRLLLPLVNTITFSLMTPLVVGGCCLLIFFFKPCKKTYMNNCDAFILALLALNIVQIDKINSNSINSDFFLWSLLATVCLPFIIMFGNLIPKKCLTKLKQNIIIGKMFNFSEQKQDMHPNHRETGNIFETDPLLHA